MHQQLKPDAIPSLFPWTTENKFAHERTTCLLRRSSVASQQHQPPSSDDLESDSTEEFLLLNNCCSYMCDLAAEETVFNNMFCDSVATEDAVSFLPAVLVNTAVHSM